MKLFDDHERSYIKVTKSSQENLNYTITIVDIRTSEFASLS